MKIGYGLYARARINRINGKIMPDNPAGTDEVMIEAMERLGVDYQFDEFSHQSLFGKSTQVPAKIRITPQKPTF